MSARRKASAAVKRRTSQAGRLFVCDRCGDTMPCDVTCWRCECGGPLSPVLPQFRKKSIARDVRSVWRYGAMLPADAVGAALTLGEAGTPLVPVSIVGMPVHAKLEFMQPSGTHKDRGSAVLASALAAAGVRQAVEDSSGNAGASLAAYLARANIHLRLFVPTSTPAAKLRQAAAHGAKIDRSARGRARAGKLAQEAASDGPVYASHVFSPHFLAGQMTLAWEIWEGLGHSVPDNIVAPAGHGILVLGLYRGFRALVKTRLAQRVPRIFAVQARACAPLYEAFMRGAEEPTAVPAGRTCADGIRVTAPPRGREVLAAIAATGGAMLNVSEAEIRRGQALAANLGWYIEPSSAVAVAGLVKLDKVIDAGESIVVPITGSGLKA